MGFRVAPEPLPVRPEGLEDPILFDWRAPMQELIQVPLTICAEAEGRVLRNQIHCLIENAALDRGDLRLVIGIAHIKMHVRHKK